MVEGWKEISLNEIGWFKGAGVNKLSNIDEQPVYLVNYMDVYKHWQIYFNNNYQEVTAKEREKQEANLLVGDILFTPSSEKPIDIGHAGVIMEEMPDCVYSYHLIRYRLNDKSKFDMNFISYLLNSDDVQKHFVSRASGSGIRYTLSLNDFKSLKIRFPQKTEQASIANILSKVDEAIESVKKSIDAAEKLKKSLMQNLLTGRMKPDGTLRTEEEFYEDEKFGKVPIGWEVNRFKEFAVLQRGNDLTDNDVVQGDYPVVKSNGVSIYHNKYFVEPPGVVTGRSGTIGKAFYIEERFWAHNTTLYVKDFKGNVPKYIYYLILSMDFSRYYAGTTVPTLNRNDIHKLKVIIPKVLEEQQKIVSVLDASNVIINDKQNKITALERLKKSLMQNLLTGKVRVGDIEIKGGLQNG